MERTGMVGKRKKKKGKGFLVLRGGRKKKEGQGNGPPSLFKERRRAYRSRLGK